MNRAPEPVDRYLDRLFDLLAGTGTRGRRALAEAEAHLTESVDALMREGRSPEDAAREAIARFGTPESVARAVLAGGLPFWALVGRIAAAAWLLGAVGLVSIGVSGGLNWAVGARFGPGALAPDAPAQTYSPARCAVLLDAYPRAGSCRAASVLHHAEELVYRPVSAGVFGLILLALFRAARRSPRFRGFTILPPPGMVTLAGVTAFGGAAGVLTLIALQRLQIDQTWGIGADFTRAASALVAALVFLPGAWRELRNRAAHG